MSNAESVVEQLSRVELLAQLDVLLRRHSTSTVLFHHVLAEVMGLNPTDHKCLDLIIQHGAISAGQLAEMTGLATGTITAVLDRLEKAKYVRRIADPHDRRKVLLEAIPERLQEAALLFTDFLAAKDQLLARYTDEELRVIADFLAATIQFNDEQRIAMRQKAASLARK